MVEHIPVLYQEVIEYLAPRSGGLFVDGTIGAGGHAAGILEASRPDGRLLGIDRDPEAVAFAAKKLSAYGERLTIARGSFGNLAQIAPKLGFGKVDGILLDLGLSSRQLANGDRGFSFSSNGPLDMRFDGGRGSTAADLVNGMSETELANILFKYGEERNSRQIAAAIVSQRPVRFTSELTEIIESVSKRRGRRHPATQVFQALRIAVNDELNELDQGLKSSITLLNMGARLAVISFHSLEDRLVKQFFRNKSRDCMCPPEQPICTCETKPTLRLITRKVVRPTDQEIISNPRSRSARLRVAERISGDWQ